MTGRWIIVPTESNNTITLIWAPSEPNESLSVFALSNSPRDAGTRQNPKLRPNAALPTTNPDPTGVRMIDQACADYALQREDIWAAAQKRSEEAWAKYVGEAEAIYNAAATRFEELYRGYLSAVEKITAAEDPQSVAEAEYNELVRKAKEVWTPADNSKLYEAYSRYVNEL